MQGFAYHKPHGYAGDFEIIDRIYQRYACSDEMLTRWDNFWQAHPAAQAVRNRTAYLISLVFKSVTERRRPIHVLNLASGPSRDVYECCRLIDGVIFDCIEQSRLEESLHDAVIVERWSVNYFMNLLSSCQLYDYKNKQWLTFDGH
jgi:hypothetical protein